MSRFTALEKKNFRRAFYLSSAVWSLGNAFASGIAVLLLLTHWGGLPWGTASMHAFIAPIVGNLFRIFSPILQKICPNCRSLSVGLYLFQAVCLCSAALICWFTRENDAYFVSLFLILWYTSNICENLAHVTLLVWARSLIHRKSLGRFFALRERWRLTGEVCVFFLCGILINSFREICFGREFPAEYLRNIYPGFLFCAGIFSGGCVWFLRKLPNRSAETETGPDPTETGERNAEELPAVSSGLGRLFCSFFGKLWKPLKDPIFRWVVLYGILFAFFTQAEQPIRSKFQYMVTNRDGLLMLWGVAGQTFVTRGGQILAASFAGKWVDRLGTLRVMGLSQILTAFAYLFYIAAALMPNILFLYGASAVWICYVGLNAALPKFLMDHAGPDKVSRPAVYGFLSGVGGICGAFFGKSIFNRFSGLLDHCILVFTVFLCVRMLLSLPIFIASGIARKRDLSEPAE